jgi:hypothetical protein
MRRPSQSRLSVQPLEGREVPACIVSHPLPDTLVITGNGANDTVVLRDNGAGVVTGAATGWGGFGFAGIRHIIVNTGAGHDQVYYNLMGNLLPGQDRDLDVNLGVGNDRFAANLYHPVTGVGSDLLVGSSMDVHAHGGDGRDVMAFNASRDTDVRVGATLKASLFGDAGPDLITGYYWGENDGTVSMLLDGGTGDDVLRGYMREDLGSTGKISGVVRGGEGKDALSLFMYTQGPPSTAILDGGAGFDTGSATPNVTKINIP